MHFVVSRILAAKKLVLWDSAGESGPSARQLPKAGKAF